MRKHFPSTGVSHPLDGFFRRPHYEDKDTSNSKPAHLKMRTNVFVEAIPATFHDHNDLTLGMLKTEAFILNAQHETNYNADENILVVNYNVNPLCIEYSNARENIFQFIVNLFAIIGGVFVIMGIFDSIMHKSIKVVFKDSINKLA